jgi:hypothetical protein
MKTHRVELLIEKELILYEQFYEIVMEVLSTSTDLDPLHCKFTAREITGEIIEELARVRVLEKSDGSHI